MKNMKYIIPIILIFFCVILYVIYTETTCSLDNCDNKRVKNGKYCSEHTCEWEGCTARKGSGKLYYCYYHIEQNNLQNQDDEIVLTDSQVSKAKQAIQDYCTTLMAKQSNILAVNLINEYPEYVSEYSCSFRCNVVREDGNMNLGTMHLSIKSDGTFEVDKLIYDKN